MVRPAGSCFELAKIQVLFCGTRCDNNTEMAAKAMPHKATPLQNVTD